MPCVAIVDDNMLVRHTTQYILSSKSISVIFEAENGQECIEKMTDSLKRPDIVILDLDMPVMDGYQTAVILKASWPEIKIIAFSGTNDPVIIQKAFAAGADHFFSKLENPVQLLDLIQSITQQVFL
jgi:DNA-binding NarL/FixJ family response regulator